MAATMPDFTARRRTMVDTQVRPADVTKFPIIDAMLAVRREAFVPEALVEAAYVGDALDIGGRVLLEPRVLAKMLDALDIDRRDLVLDVGCGLGYSAAVLGRMAEAVVGVEDDEDRANEAQRLLSEEDFDNVAVLAGALDRGAAKHGPYDGIVIQGAVEEIPEAIVAQLKDGGRICAIFADGHMGRVMIGTRRGAALDWRFVFNASAPVLAGFERSRAFQL